MLALPCCCSCRQAMATELKKQKPLEGKERSCQPIPSPCRTPSTCLWPGPAPESSEEGGETSQQEGLEGLPPTSAHPGLPQALHGCGMVCMVSWGPNHSKTVLETERMLVNRRVRPLTHASMNLPPPTPSPGSSPEKGPQGNSCQCD